MATKCCECGKPAWAVYLSSKGFICGSCKDKRMEVQNAKFMLKQKSDVKLHSRKFQRTI